MAENRFAEAAGTDNLLLITDSYKVYLILLFFLTLSLFNLDLDVPVDILINRSRSIF